VEDFRITSSYIKEELNCLELEIITNEADYVIYQTTPDHKEMGSVLKKAFTKQLKERVSNLTREEVLEYLNKGSVTVEGVEIKKGWITVSKLFNEKYTSMTEIGVDSNLDAAVILDLHIDTELKQMGMAREIINKVQKLRKEAKLNIED
jgi:isoleucyl-tRNA synthetase